jgi:uncharacterized protein Usg
MHDPREMELMLQGYGLTTAEILYHMPDHPHLIQSFVWQEYDLAPKFPALYGFIDFWKEKLDGPPPSRRVGAFQREEREFMGMRQDLVHLADIGRVGDIGIVAEKPPAGRASDPDRRDAARG